MVTVCASRKIENTHPTSENPPRSPTNCGIAVATMVESIATSAMANISATNTGVRWSRRDTATSPPFGARSAPTTLLTHRSLDVWLPPDSNREARCAASPHVGVGQWPGENGLEAAPARWAVGTTPRAQWLLPVGRTYRLPLR